MNEKFILKANWILWGVKDGIPTKHGPSLAPVLPI